MRIAVECETKREIFECAIRHGRLKSDVTDYPCRETKVNSIGFDWASIIDSALIVGISATVVSGLAELFRVPRVIAVILVVCTIGLMATIDRKQIGLTVAPYIRAEIYDYDAALQRNPVVSVLEHRHPELKPRLVRIMKKGVRETIPAVQAQLEMQAVLQEYLHRYFARSTDIAMSVYDASWRTLLTHLHITDPSACQAFLHGEKPLPVHLLPPDFVGVMLGQTETVIRHAIHTPQAPPSPEWVQRTLARLMGREVNNDVLFAAVPGFTCHDYLKLHRIAKRHLGGPDYFRLLRGIIAGLYRGKLSEA